MHEWMTDNGNTPFLIVDATLPGVQVPRESVEDGKITLNASHAAVRGLVLGNEEIVFEARFSGRPFEVRVPFAAVRGIYARETGQGMIFAEEERSSESGDSNGDDAPPPAGNRSHLKVIK